MLDTMGVILTANGSSDLGDLTRVRSIAALPYGGRYRLIDFVLSNLVNSGVTNIGIATDYNYQSLLDHIGSGKPWGLARKKYGLRFLPPFHGSSAADERMRMLFDVLHFMKRSQQKYVIVAYCNNVCNMRFEDIIAKHKESNADLTVIYRTTAEKDYGTAIEVKDGKVVDVVDDRVANCKLDRTAGYFVFTKDLFINYLERCQTLGKRDFVEDIIKPYFAKHNVQAYKYEGYLEPIGDINSYYNASMALMCTDIRKSLFVSDNRILTKVMDKVPTRYLNNAKVKNSFIADGCVIDGEVENCILFRGVTVAKGAKVKDSIIMQNTIISENVRLSACIIDKDCLIRKDKELVGQPEFPVIVGKHRTI